VTCHSITSLERASSSGGTVRAERLASFDFIEKIDALASSYGNAAADAAKGKPGDALTGRGSHHETKKGE
jgi:hypothetical protein